LESAKAPDPPDWFTKSQKALKAGQISYFAQLLAPKDHWRIAASFPRECLFFDIETTGFSPNYHYITIIGWSMGGEFKVLVHGRDDPAEFLADLAKAKALVSFNGRCFDLRFLYQAFGQDVFPAAHADLRNLCKQVDLTGGLKNIEFMLNINRDIEPMAGEKAVALWEEYSYFGRSQKAKKKALRQLIQYNYYDVEGMKTIFDVCLDRLIDQGQTPDDYSPQKIFSRLKCCPDFSDPDYFPFSLDLLD
jgi:uncharacterized protein YprB with RNaseH-like and TPR domain